MATPPVLTEIRFPAFKSVRDAVLPLRDLTLLVGRNGSGKSNVLDGLWVLSQLASGGDIRALLDGGRDGPSVRGGAEGCAPIGETSFSLGCSVASGATTVHLDLTVCVDPVVQVAHERLALTTTSASGRTQTRVLLETEPSSIDSADVVARWDNRKRGPNPAVTFRASHLVTSQVATRVPSTSQAGRDVHDAASVVLRTLGDVFVLDPVPQAMRRYVPARDVRLRRQADNLSAVLARLLHDDWTRGRLLEIVQSLSESQVVAMDTIKSTLDDVMISQTEMMGDRRVEVPARLMSDGTLRVLAVLAALLEEPGERGVTVADDPDRAQTTLVIEEIENGLHPSQAAAMVARVREESVGRNVRTLATTHSPAMLDALHGDDHDGVVVCAREDGWTKLYRLTELPNYFTVVAGGTLGAAATSDRLRPRDATIERDVLDRVLGVR
jgi:hypothetical protein